MWDSVGLVHESLSAVPIRKRRMRTATDSWQTGHRDSVHGGEIRSAVRSTPFGPAFRIPHSEF